MQDTTNQNQMSIEELAGMVARGFEDVMNRMATKDDIANMATKDDIARLDSKIDRLEQRLNNFESRIVTEIMELRKDIEAFVSKSDDRYLELKHRQDVLAGWMLKLAEKNQIQLDLKDLEYKH